MSRGCASTPPACRDYHGPECDDGTGPGWMKRMGEADAGAEERRAKSAARAAGLADLGVGAAVKRYFLVNFPLSLLAGLGAGFTAAFFWRGTDEDFLRSGVPLGLQLAGLGILVGGWVYGSRKVSANVQPRRIGVTVGLTPDEAKRVRRQVLAREPVGPDDMAVLRGAAVQMREGLARQLLPAPGFLLLFGGQALARGAASVFDVVMLAATLALVVLWGFVARDFRQAGVFLSSTAARRPTKGPDHTAAGA
jgi:hypothetical protein